jgi:hypothetical protein
MREYVVGSSSAGPVYLRVVVGGITKSGKTHFASTWPKPLFIADAAEGGADTLKEMSKNQESRNLWWDPKTPPTVHEIENMMEFPQEVTKLVNLAAQKKFPFQTVVVDSISIYAQRVLREKKRNDPGQDNRQRYGDLADALSAQIDRLHSLPCHVVWLCHIDESMQLAVPGKASSVLWAYMGYLWMVHVEALMGKAPDYQLHIRPYLRATWIGGRRNKIEAPSPIIPSFKVLAELLDLPDRPVSPACPKFGGVDYSQGATYIGG